MCFIQAYVSQRSTILIIFNPIFCIGRLLWSDNLEQRAMEKTTESLSLIGADEVAENNV